MAVAEKSMLGLVCGCWVLILRIVSMRVDAWLRSYLLCQRFSGPGIEEKVFYSEVPKVSIRGLKGPFVLAAREEGSYI